MKNLIALLLLLTLSFGVVASEGIKLQEANIDLSDNDSLQRGAQHFVTYCLGCHSAKHIRYLRIALRCGCRSEENVKRYCSRRSKYL